MAKETTIIFTYDTKKLQREEDDPASAILYFHPTWVSDQQKTSLCGQIIGTIMCLKSIFSLPKLIHLQTGKFFIIENGRYILAVGTDRNISDWVLEHRANLLYSLINFFNKDFETLSQIYYDDALSAKLYHLFETYLKMLFFGSNIFSHIPVLCLPKSASNVFTEAMTFLETCREFPNVLGGSLLFHNKVVATQLTSEVAKKLVLADPYRIKSPAERGEADFDLPLGVQLLQVYITNKEFCDLLEISLRNRCIFQYLTNKSLKREHVKKNSTLDTPLISHMKRDQSLLFTAVPEEGQDSISQSPTDFQPVNNQKKSRPKFLNLKSLSTDATDTKINVRNTPMTPFCGQTSVASTPMTELKRFVLQNPLTIVNKDCSVTEDLKKISETESEIPESNINELNAKAKLKYCTLTPQNMFFFSMLKRSNSLIKLSDILNSIAKHETQYLKLKNRLNLSPEKKKLLRRSKSIGDPSFPIENKNGLCVSVYLFREQVKNDSLEAYNLRKEVKSNHYSSIKSDNSIKNDQNMNKINVDLKPPLKLGKEQRKSLSLPLKSVGDMNGMSKTDRKLSSGVQLTPLMSKLSILAFEERQNKQLKDATPMTPSMSQNFGFSAAKSTELKNFKMAEENSLQKCILFVCGQQDIVLELLLKEECCKDKETINKLWELCTEHILKLEKQLKFCLECQSTGPSTQDSEPYSFLCLDSKWDTVKRGGPWGTGDLSSLVSLHRDFSDFEDITEIFLRNPENVVYGYRCGPSEVFYHENSNIISGVPPPADTLGLVQTKARRRLERDHNVLLL